MSYPKPRKPIIKVKRFPCETCHKQFSTKFSMQRHFRECGVTPNRVECGKCKKSLKNMEILEKHRQVCFGIAKKVMCGFCDELFSSRFSLRRHLWRFHQNEELEQHLQTVHQDPKPEKQNFPESKQFITRKEKTEKKIVNCAAPKTEADEKNNFCYYYMDICYDYEYLEDEDSIELEKPVIYMKEEIQE